MDTDLSERHVTGQGPVTIFRKWPQGHSTTASSVNAFPLFPDISEPDLQAGRRLPDPQGDTTRQADPRPWFFPTCKVETTPGTV